MRVDTGVQWRPLAGAELADLKALAVRVLAADGGHPLLAEPGSLARGYAGRNVTTLGGWTAEGQLAAAASVRQPESSGPPRVIATALVDPGHRGRGLGAYLLDWTLATGRAMGGISVTVETESLTEPAAALFTSRGLHQTFAEDVMRFDLSATTLPAVLAPAGVTFVPWTAELAGRFFIAYEAAFRDRPGFPGWPAAQWIDWITTDEDFRTEWSLLATDSTAGDVGFIACATGWITQVGVRPEYRGRRLGAALVVDVLRRMRDSGATEALLDVNVKNPAADLYRRLGFTLLGRRAAFRPT